MIKAKINVNSPIIDGLEKIEKIDILENNVLMIQYTITDEYMKEYDLYNKKRLLKIDTSKNDEWQAVQDYANLLDKYKEVEENA